MKRFLTVLSIAVCAIVCAFSFVACGGLKVTEVTLDKTELKLDIGGEETLTAIVNPFLLTKTVSWSSDNPAVATVKNGKVKAIASGTATVTAKAGEKSAACTVSVNVGHEVGQYAPDFTVGLCGKNQSFNLYENRGKLIVINFWDYWCLPSIVEMPYFNELAEKHTECSVIAIHGIPYSDLPQFIREKGWSDYVLTFAQDNVLLDPLTCKTYALLGGTGDWPLTVIVDSDGKIVYNSTSTFSSYAELEGLINNFIDQ